MCHLGGFAGQNEIPRVAGQHYDYIVKQLADFKARKRTNDAGNMTSVASTLSDEDIENLAHYLVGPVGRPDEPRARRILPRAGRLHEKIAPFPNPESPHGRRTHQSHRHLAGRPAQRTESLRGYL